MLLLPHTTRTISSTLYDTIKRLTELLCVLQLQKGQPKFVQRHWPHRCLMQRYTNQRLRHMWSSRPPLATWPHWGQADVTGGKKDLLSQAEKHNIIR